MVDQEESSGLKRKRLHDLSHDTKNNIYEMVRLAHELYKDGDFIARKYDGKIGRFLLELEEQDFSYFGQSVSVAGLLRAYEKFPDKETWAKYKFNVQAMIELARPQRQVAPREEGPTKTEMATQIKELQAVLKRKERFDGKLQDENARLKEEVARLTKVCSEKDEIIASLRAEVDRLTTNK